MASGVVNAFTENCSLFQRIQNADENDLAALQTLISAYSSQRLSLVSSVISESMNQRAIKNQIEALIHPPSLSTGLKYHFTFESEDVTNGKVKNLSTNVGEFTMLNSAKISTSTYKKGTGSLELSGGAYGLLDSFTPPSSGMTFAFWYKSNNSQVWSRGFEFSNGDNVWNNAVYFSPCGNSTNNMAFHVVYLEHNTSSLIYVPYQNTNANVWTHVAWTLTSASPGVETSTWKIYINGTLQNTYNNRLYPNPNVTCMYSYIGKTTFGTLHFNGFIDDFRVYNKVLTSTEVSDLCA